MPDPKDVKSNNTNAHDCKEKSSDQRGQNGKSRKTNYYRRRDRSNENRSPKFGEPGNDFAWWNKEPALLSNAINLVSNWIAGTELDKLNIPHVPYGAMRIELLPVYGCSKTLEDPLNVWARDLYLRMFQKYRGISSYSASDLAILLIAEMEIVKLIAKYERIYGIINRYSKLNVNMPISEVEAVGLTAAQADYLRTHLSDFRYDLNVLLRRGQRLSIMKDISLLADSISLLNYEYLDHDNVKAQIIIFDSSAYGVWSDTALSTGSSVQFKDFVGTPLFDFSTPNMCACLESAMGALLGSDSAQRIIADLVVWFGEEAMLQFLPITEDYVIVPVKDDTILHKLHNIETNTMSSPAPNSVVPTGMSSTDKAVLQAGAGIYYIYQYNDTVISAISISNGGGAHSAYLQDGFEYLVGAWTCPSSSNCPAHILDTYRAAPDPEVLTEGSLFKHQSVKIKDTSSNTTNAIISSAFWIPIKISLIKVSNGGAASVAVNLQNTTAANAQQAAGQLAVVDWAPLTVAFTASNESIITSFYGDIDNPIIVAANDLYRIHTAVVYSGLRSDVTVVNK